METPKLLKKYIQTILAQQYGITSDKIKNLTESSPRKAIAEILTTHGLLTKNQFIQVVQEAKQKVVEFKKSEKLKVEMLPTEQFSSSVLALEQRTFSQKISIGRRIGKYEILQKIAQGGMGAVYQARHIELDQLYALKLILEGEHATQETIARFHREAKISAKLKHPGIVQVVDSGEEDGQHYFVMEYIEGESLSSKIQSGLSLQTGIELIRKTLKALEYAHQQGILHRDLKPGNIFVTADGEPKIGDFGLAKDTLQGPQQQHQLTQSGEILGTPAYMPPEQASGSIEDLDESADVYAMGACLYQVLTGSCPFEGKTIHELFYKIVSEEPVPPSKLNKNISQDLDTILLKTLSKERSKRYRTAKDFREELERFQNGYPILARPVSRQERFYKWIKRNRQLSIILGCTFLLVFALMSYGWIDKKITQQKKQNEAYQNAKSERDAFATEESKKIKRLLKAIHFYNVALEVNATEEIEKEKLETGVQLIKFACKTGDYELAEYIASEIKFLKKYSRKEENNDWENYVKEAKTTQLKEHQIRLRYWKEELVKIKIEPRMREKALFEIAKMQEDEILEELLVVLKEGCNYFLARQNPNARRDEYYQTMAEVLGKIGNPKAIPPLLFSLEKMKDKLAPLPQKNTDEINYMVSLTTALADLNDYQIFPRLYGIRWEMGQNGLYWNNTEHLSKELIKSEASYRKILGLINDEINRGIFKHTHGDLEGAIAEYSKALLKDPQSFKAYLNRGSTKKDIGDLNGAIADYTKALSINPQSWEAYLNRGTAKKIQQNFQGAILDYNEAISIYPQCFEAFHARGTAKHESGDIEGAIRDCTQSIHLNPQFANAFYSRAHAKYAKKDFESAIADFDQAIVLNPQYYLAYTGRGVAKKDNGDLNGAIVDFDQAISIVPQDFNSYNNRGSTKKDNGDLNGAMADFDQALAINPQYVLTYYNRGRLKQEKGDFQGAIADYTQAIDKGTKEAHIYFARGFLYSQLGEREKTKQDFIQFLQLSKNTTNPQEKRIQEFVLKLFPDLNK